MSHLHTPQDKSALIARIRRLKGQIEAIERAVESERACGEILHLVASVRGAIGGLTAELIEAHLTHHVREAADPEARRKGAEDLAKALRIYLK
ncbi:metal/formaldehyde-sensitive transcriptional repressor [Phaeovulum vinaykumarii]|uniref:DNA-binding transcriptional regulator, FrmR family n=1 Tax=Phaeovulum vinaykumarii TaxID=407234 RepID=A0A1N7M7Q4_9RHOB|nr:metal/formaldehyde-sensitive transcriptional repressor [Phaeovulum vinaykumarii]SIS82117.1 DNA-binding transcriptional regulator, FrmR family [Phaeovulum vinaykumarii]SOC11186.1 DNA-binding FrmR family transcriptional regulator [Phaeovulum vinaykumarii]